MFSSEGQSLAGTLPENSWASYVTAWRCFWSLCYGKAMTGTGACAAIAERPPAEPSNILAKLGRDVRIRYSTVGVVPSANSADPSSGRLWR